MFKGLLWTIGIYILIGIGFYIYGIDQTDSFDIQNVLFKIFTWPLTLIEILYLAGYFYPGE